jgi:hypothetical protein
LQIFFNDFFYNTEFFWGGKLNYKKEKRKRKMEIKPLDYFCPPKKSVPLFKKKSLEKTSS